ncbi:MAG TPA: hypothetical protein VFV86_06760 [Nitrososphaeraceae archaeon]|jgi:hypothetical protein|nr:hypothetical protein [Nitrososphaeraceae archaeon]
MNKFTKEIANILQAQIDNQPYEVQQSGLTNDQLEEINKFARKYNRSGFGPFPLKYR